MLSRKIILYVTLLTLFATHFLFASNGITFTFQGGILESGDSFHGKDYDMGFLFGGTALVPIEKFKQFSGVAEFSYAMANNEETLADKTGVYDSESEFSSLTLLTLLRYTIFTRNDISLFAEAGCGVSYEKKLLKMTPKSNSFDTGTDTDIPFGIAYGGGVRVSRHFEITVLNREFNNESYLTATLGFVFR